MLQLYYIALNCITVIYCKIVVVFSCGVLPSYCWMLCSNNLKLRSLFCPPDIILIWDRIMTCINFPCNIDFSLWYNKFSLYHILMGVSYKLFVKRRFLSFKKSVLYLNLYNFNIVNRKKKSLQHTQS